MDILFLGIIIFLFVLAVFDLTVGVSNDAVNFMNSALGSKAAGFRTIVIVAAVGIFIGAASSNGMMDIARHGIFRPEYFSFYDLICVFMAVMVTDIILLDAFNTIGMPTSTTVSMVFELLGAAFVIALFKVLGNDTGLSLMDYLNTGKALSVILGIFLSVAIAFVFGTVVQFITRAIFSFEYGGKGAAATSFKYKIGIFGGLATTAIVYFLLINGAKDMVWMRPEMKQWIATHTALILVVCMVFFTLLMQLLHALKINVLKIVVLIGTFALAMAFAGNDLVNFIGVPLSGFASWQDFVAGGGGDPHAHTMGVLNEPAQTPLYFLIGAGVIMVVSLATSKKGHNVTKTEIGLGSQGGDDEMFSSSRIARSVVRTALSIHSWIIRWMPRRLRLWIDRRFDTSKMNLEQGASFDLIRASVNLMLAGMLIAAGTSMKLPLSTTFVTFMVAMGSSLADRAWSRESAVFRITGVISVIGGWFVTAGVAFIGAAIVAALMHWGGSIMMIVISILAVALLIHSNIKFKRNAAKEDKTQDTLLHTIFTTQDRAQVWPLLKVYMDTEQCRFLTFAGEQYRLLTDAFMKEDVRTLGKVEKALFKEKGVLKTTRRKETLCLQRLDPAKAIENSAWFHMAGNMSMSMNYNLRRMTETCKEHVENNFLPLPQEYRDTFISLRDSILEVVADAASLIDSMGSDQEVAPVAMLRARCEKIKDEISAHTYSIYGHIRNGSKEKLTVTYVCLNMLQESQEFVSSLRKLLRASAKLSNASRPVRAVESQYALP